MDVPSESTRYAWKRALMRNRTVAQFLEGAPQQDCAHLYGDRIRLHDARRHAGE